MKKKVPKKGPAIAGLELELSDADARVERAEAALGVLQDARTRVFMRLVLKKFGVAVGDRVIAMKSSLYKDPYELEYQVCAISDHFSSDGQPWVSGHPVKKDGTVSKKVVHPLYERWRVKEKARG